MARLNNFAWFRGKRTLPFLPLRSGQTLASLTQDGMANNPATYQVILSEIFEAKNPSSSTLPCVSRYMKIFPRTRSPLAEDCPTVQ